jgi:hypothetical protein
MEQLNIFISYAKKDYGLMTAIEESCKQIRPITFAGKKYKINIWSDNYILPGELWKKAIVEKIKSADVVLFLISPNFISSEFITNTEIPLAMERHEESGIGILGVYMEQCDFNQLALRKTQLVPSYHGHLKPISVWKGSKICWVAIKDGIEICAYSSISKMPQNRGLPVKLPARLQEKRFINNAPPALQQLRKMVVKAKNEKKQNAQRRKDELHNLIFRISIAALIILLIYIKFFA